LLRKPDKTTSPEAGSSPVKYSLLCYSDSELTSMVDIETVTEPDCEHVKQLTPRTLNTQFSSDLNTPVKSTSPEPDGTHSKRNSNNLTPNAKRSRRSQSNDCSPPVQTMHTTLKTTPLKNFSIALSDSLKSPTRSPTSCSKLSASPQHIQSPKQCIISLPDVTKSPNLYINKSSPVSNRNARRVIRSTSVSPKQKEVDKDLLIRPPVKEEQIQSPMNVHTICDVPTKSQDILLGSSQTTPQKQY